MFTDTIKIKTVSKKTLGDLHTPMNIYLKIRDKFRDTILLESSDSKSIDNNFSFIAVNAIAGIEVKNLNEYEIKLPASAPVKQFMMERNITDIFEEPHNTSLQSNMDQILLCCPTKHFMISPNLFHSWIVPYNNPTNKEDPPA